ncbi:hypothetical protein CRE_16257 [Caenorhabditis remanei]|uniref:Uncharacterized protein n=1 Tax=Caenorhabditis remanei TaxID=31234 RepID=E3N2J8_CAERE|nr:hypothetical protein CRE_16257 [Caenorhabditis remanei]
MMVSAGNVCGHLDVWIYRWTHFYFFFEFVNEFINESVDQSEQSRILIWISGIKYNLMKPKARKVQISLTELHGIPTSDFRLPGIFSFRLPTSVFGCLLPTSVIP